MTTTTYLIAWAIYLLAGGGLFAIAWHISKTWQSIELRMLSRLTLLIGLFTPYYSDPAQDRLSPALLTTLFEALFGNKETAIKAGTPLLLLLLVALAVSLLTKLKHNKPPMTPD